MGGSKRPDDPEPNYELSHGVSLRAAASDTAGCRCVRFRVLACCRVGKRGAFAKTVVTSGGPSSNPLARRFSRPGVVPTGCADDPARE